MQCILYKNTGYNVINRPSTPAVLDSISERITTTTLNVIQNRTLSQITVRQSWENIQNCDYAKVGDFYYIISSVTMASSDCATLSLIPDYVTSAGGARNLEYLDGITERYIIPSLSDVFGAYCEADPLIAPAKPLQIVTDDSLMGSVGGDIHLIEATIDLETLGSSDYDFEAITYTDTASGESVTVPDTPDLESNMYTSFSIHTGGVTTEWRTMGSCIFDGGSYNAFRGLQIARKLGMEQVIKASYVVPLDYIEVTHDENKTGWITSIKAIEKTLTPSDALAFDYADVQNKRLLYGEHNRYGILSASGNKTEANPEDIRNGNAVKPSTTCYANAGKNGHPFFSFSYFRGPITGLPKFMQNAVGGAEWRNEPIAYVERSNTIRDAYNFQSESKTASVSHVGEQMSYGLGIAGNIAGTVSSIATGNISGTLGGVTATAQTAINASQNQLNYELARERALFNFAYDREVTQPEIFFPFSNDMLRDFVGNGCMMYRYRYDAEDLRRLDRLLNMYGYRITAPLDASMFMARVNFSYVKATGVTIGGDLPSWWKDGISNEISNGIRVWSVKPSASYYANGQNP